MVKPAAGYQPLACSSPEAVQITGTVAAFGSSNSLGPCDFKDFVAPSHTTNDHCVRFAVVVTFPNTTLVTRRALPLTWAGLSPAGSRQLRLAHCYSFIAVDFHHILLASLPAHSLALRPVGLLNRPRRPLSRGFDPAGYPTKPLVSYQSNRQFPGWILPPLVIRAIGAHCRSQDLSGPFGPSAK